MSICYKSILIVILSISFASCYDKHSRKNHTHTTELQKGLFVETYTVFGSGAFGTDMVAQYLTDSLYFRKYIGTFDEGVEYYYYKVSGDAIYVEKYKSGINNGAKKMLQREEFFFSELQKSNNIK